MHVYVKIIIQKTQTEHLVIKAVKVYGTNGIIRRKVSLDDSAVQLHLLHCVIKLMISGYKQFGLNHYKLKKIPKVFALWIPYCCRYLLDREKLL